MLDKIDRIVELVLKTLVTVILGALSILVAYTVVLRFLFNTGFPAGEELCRYLFVWAAFFGIILGVKAKGHMRLGFLEEKVPKLRLFTKIVDYVFHYIFFGMTAWHGIAFAGQAANARSTLLPITMNYIYAAVPVCAILCIIVVTLNLLREFSRSDGQEGGRTER